MTIAHDVGVFIVIVAFVHALKADMLFWLLAAGVLDTRVDPGTS